MCGIINSMYWPLSRGVRSYQQVLHRLWAFTGKDPDSGKDWSQEKGIIENKIVGWYHQLNGHEFEQTQEDGEGQGSLACCSPMGSQIVGHGWVTEQQQWTFRGKKKIDPWSSVHLRVNSEHGLWNQTGGIQTSLLPHPVILSKLPLGFSFLICVCVRVSVHVHGHTCTYTLSCVQLFSNPWTVVHQAPLSMGFSWQKYRSGLPCTPPWEPSRPRDWTHVSCIACRFITLHHHLKAPSSSAECK